MNVVVEKFNVLQRRFGVLEVVRVDHCGLVFAMGFRKYFIGQSGLFEVCEEEDRIHATAHSEWLDAIARGFVRDPDGNMVLPVIA